MQCTAMLCEILGWDQFESQQTITIENNEHMLSLSLAIMATRLTHISSPCSYTRDENKLHQNEKEVGSASTSISARTWRHSHRNDIQWEMHSCSALVQVIAHHDSYDDICHDDNGVEHINGHLYRCVRNCDFSKYRTYIYTGDRHQIWWTITVKNCFCVINAATIDFLHVIWSNWRISISEISAREIHCCLTYSSTWSKGGAWLGQISEARTKLLPTEAKTARNCPTISWSRSFGYFKQYLPQTKAGFCENEVQLKIG